MFLSGILALVVIVLVLVAVVTVVIMRNRGSVGIDGDGFDDEVCGDKSGTTQSCSRFKGSARISGVVGSASKKRVCDFNFLRGSTVLMNSKYMHSSVS